MADALFCIVVLGVGLVAIRISRRGRRLESFKICLDCRLGHTCDYHRLHN